MNLKKAKKLRRQVKKDSNVLVNKIVIDMLNNKPWWIPMFIYKIMVKGLMK